MKFIMNKLRRRRAVKRVFETSADVVSALNVPDDEPVLRAILTLMEAQEQVYVEAGGAAGLPADEAKVAIRNVNCLQEMAELILEAVEEGRKRGA